MNSQDPVSAHETRLRQLLLQSLDGDSAAYQAFLKDAAARLRAYFRKRMTRWPDDVEDMVQETLLALHNQRHTYDPSVPLTAWMYAIAKYKFVDALRRRSTREDLSDSLDDMTELLVARDDSAGEAQRDLTQLLEQLPDRFRLPIVHTKLEGLSVAETAHATGMSESAVKVGVHRGLKALAALIQGKT